jgi:MYND finger
MAAMTDKTSFDKDMERLDIVSLLEDQPRQIYEILPYVELLDPDCDWMHNTSAGPIIFPDMMASSSSSSSSGGGGGGFPKDYSKWIAREIVDEESRRIVSDLMNGDDIGVSLREIGMIKRPGDADYTTLTPEEAAAADLLPEGSEVVRGASLCYYHCDSSQPAFWFRNFQNRHGDGEERVSFEMNMCGPLYDAKGTCSDLFRHCLGLRLLHFFVRQHASRMVHFFSPADWMSLLMTGYESHGVWKDYVDIAILNARWMFRGYPQAEFTDHASLGLLRTGHALDALGRYKQASEWYAMIANTVLKDHELGVGYLETAYISRFAFEDYDMAGVLLLELFRRLLKRNDLCKNRRIDPNLETFCKHLDAMMLVCSRWSNGISDLFIMVLYFAGFTVSEKMGKTSEATMSLFVKRQVRSKIGAQMVLFDALQKGTVEHFKATISDVANGSFDFPDDKICHIASSHSQKMYTKKDFQERIQSFHQPMIPCDFCEKLQEDVKACPCQTVFYCSKECQTKHWKNGHKQHCPKFGRSSSK